MLVLITTGLQVPETPLAEVAGSAGAVAPKQNGPIGPKLGVTEFVTVMVLLEVNGAAVHVGVVA